MKGKVYQFDTNQPIPNASIVLLDEKKSDQQDNSTDTKSGEQGNYSLANVVAGVYTVSIRAWYFIQTLILWMNMDNWYTLSALNHPTKRSDKAFPSEAAWP